jgi:hypothetical protein
MISGSLTSTLRPIRIAFVIPPWDRAAALQAMRISSFLWGGTYNPIIPFHQRLARRNPFFSGARSAREVFQGYLKAYDPDFVVRLGGAKLAQVDLGRYQEVDGDEILAGIRDDGTPRYGVGLFEILGHLFREEFRFVRRKKIVFEIPDVQDSLLWTSIFGGLHPDLEEVLDQHLHAFPHFKRISCDKDNYLGLFRNENFFLRRLTNQKIQSRRKGFRDDWVYMMDGSSVEDLVFYWNLRALGWQILPVPLAAKDSPTVRSHVEEYIEGNYWPYRNNSSMFNHTTLLKAPSISKKDHEEFAASLKLKPAKKEGFGKLSIQPWIPRFWSGWDRRRNGGERSEVTVRKTDVKLSPIENRFYVPSLLPEFAADFSGHGTPRCANELEPRIYGETGTYAEVIPEGGEDLSRAVHRFSIRELRCSADGLVWYPSHKNWEHRLELPQADAVFQAWFKERGWGTALSDNGHIVRHVLKQFGGAWGAKWLTDEVVLTLLHKIASEKWLGRKAFRELVHQTASKVDFVNSDRLTSWLVHSNIVKLGIELVCPKCRQRSWFSVAEADYEIDCRQCLETFKLPSASPEDIRWAYRGHGAFTSRHGTQGALAVILTLHFFMQPMGDQVTPMFSFIAKQDGEEMEIDLALHTRRIRGGFPERNVLFAECKSYNEFEKVDVDRMESFTRSFPGAAMVFATLRREITGREIGMLTRVARRSFKQRLRGSEPSPLIILTGNELFSSTDHWTTWERLGGKFSRYGHWPSHQEEIDGLAEATQALYLNFDVNDQLRRLRSQR